tara:strand:+ start:613 stop:759 length:147 start_codon:yes stop_codon:yes gene_type:complete
MTNPARLREAHPPSTELPGEKMVNLEINEFWASFLVLCISFVFQLHYI